MIPIYWGKIDNYWGRSMSGNIGGSPLRAYRADDLAVISHHFHNAYELIFIEEGEAEFIIDGKLRRYRGGDIIFISHLEQHQMRPLSPTYTRYIAIVEPDYFDRFISDQALRSIFKNRPANFENGISLSKNDSALVCGLMRECAAEYTERALCSELAVMSRLLTIVIMLYRGYTACFPAVPSDRYTANAALIQSYLDHNYLEEFTLDDLAAHFHLNKFHLLEVFREVTGYTIKRYIMLKRISHAKNQLYYTGNDISQVALESGFNSTSNFIRAFRRYEHITPLQFRKLGTY